MKPHRSRDDETSWFTQKVLRGLQLLRSIGSAEVDGDSNWTEAEKNDIRRAMAWIDSQHNLQDGK